jgi:TonB family protein
VSEYDGYCRTLEVEPGASLEEIRQAYRDQTRVWHPDRFPNDIRLQKKAEEKLKQINLAYQRLCGRGTYEPPILSRFTDPPPQPSPRWIAVFVSSLRRKLMKGVIAITKPFALLMAKTVNVSNKVFQWGRRQRRSLAIAMIAFLFGFALGVWQLPRQSETWAKINNLRQKIIETARGAARVTVVRPWYPAPTVLSQRGRVTASSAETAVPTPPPSLVDRLLREGIDLRHRGDTTNALARLREALESDPNNPTVLEEMANTYESMQPPDRSNEMWRKLLAMDPSAGAPYDLADQRLNLGVPMPPMADAATTSSSAPFRTGSFGVDSGQMAGNPSLKSSEVGSHQFSDADAETTARPSGHVFPWKTNVVTTVFWVGEKQAAGKTSPQHQSAWDKDWLKSFGGVDPPEPSARHDYIPIAFVPRQNPFYCALPYNDVEHGQFKPEAPIVIPWFEQAHTELGQSVCKDRWVGIRKGDRTCYAQWEDCGPFRTDHFQYVFQNERPTPNASHGAGLSVSPAVRDYLGLSPTDVADWRFAEVSDVPRGPWRNYGENNHFVMARGQLEKGFAEQKRSANQAATEPAQSPPASDESVISPSAAKLEKGFAEQKRYANPAARKAVQAPRVSDGSVISPSAAKAVTTYAPLPGYPQDARSHRIAGSGVCVVSVDPASGSVTQASMAQSTGSPLLDKSVLSTVRTWKFKPRTVSKVRIPVEFR